MLSLRKVSKLHVLSCSMPLSTTQILKDSTSTLPGERFWPLTNWGRSRGRSQQLTCHRPTQSHLHFQVDHVAFERVHGCVGSRSGVWKTQGDSSLVNSGITRGSGPPLTIWGSLLQTIGL